MAKLNKGWEHGCLARCPVCHAEYETKDYMTFSHKQALIAEAAPDLLALLERIYSDLRQGAIPNKDDEWWEKTAAAIRRTKGGASAGEG